MAHTSGLMTVPGWGPVVIDLASLDVGAERVLHGPAAGGRVEVAGAVGVQTRLGVELARREQDRVHQERVELGHDVAEGVVSDLVEDRAALVQHQPYRIQVVGQQPVDSGVESVETRKPGDGPGAAFARRVSRTSIERCF